MLAIHSLQSTRVVKDKHIKTKPRIYVAYYLCLTWTVNANSLKNKIVRLLKKYVLGCHFSVYIISYSSNQGGSQEHISLIA